MVRVKQKELFAVVRLQPGEKRSGIDCHNADDESKIDLTGTVARLRAGLQSQADFPGLGPLPGLGLWFRREGRSQMRIGGTLTGE